MRAALLAAGLCLLAPVSFAAPSDPYERNYAFLLGTLPEGSIMEVTVAQDGAWVTQLWSAEQYAAFRATHAAGMGRDYQAEAEGVPSGPGDGQYIGDLWGDFFGTLTVNVATPRGLPFVPVDSKVRIYGGAVTLTELDSGCFPGWICSMVYGWSWDQTSFRCEEAWVAGSGWWFLFPPPFGGIAQFNGLVLCDAPGT